MTQEDNKGLKQRRNKPTFLLILHKDNSNVQVCLHRRLLSADCCMCVFSSPCLSLSILLFAQQRLRPAIHTICAKLSISYLRRPRRTTLHIAHLAEVEQIEFALHLICALSHLNNFL